MRLASGLDGVEINGIVTAVGSVTIRADSNGSVYFGSSASVTSDSIQQYGNLTDLNVLFSATTANESRGNIIIVGRNLLTQSSVTFSADNQISATMSGNITIGENNTIASDILISTPALGSIFTDQSVILTSSGSNKRVSIGSGTSIDGDSITLQGGIVTVAGLLTSYGATDALGSIKINSTSGNINFSTATITSAQSITLSSSGSVIGGGSTFSATGTVGGFTINNFGASINGSVSLSSSSITAKLVQVDAHGAVAMDGSNQIDKLAYIKSNGGDISLSTGSDLAIAGGETLTTGNTVRTITLNVGGTMSLLGNVTLRGDVVTVTANELRAAPGAPATTLGLYYYNVNRNFTYNGTQPTMILSTTPSAVLVKRID